MRKWLCDRAWVLRTVALLLKADARLLPHWHGLEMFGVERARDIIKADLTRERVADSLLQYLPQQPGVMMWPVEYWLMQERTWGGLEGMFLRAWGCKVRGVR